MPARHADAEAGGGGACSRHRDIPAWVQRQLPPLEEAALRAHLAECPDCRAEAAEVERVIEVLRSPAAPARRTDLLPRVLAQLDGEPARGAAGRWHRRPGPRRLAAAAALAVVAASAAIAGWRWLEGDTPRAREGGRLAAERALEWLERAQEPSGGFRAARWGGIAEYDVGLTGLAALAFLSRPGPPGPRAEQALDFLLRAQSDGGRFGPAIAAEAYNHGIATAALLEAFGRGRDERLRAPIDRALSHIERTRSGEGGWGYAGGAGDGANTAATCWPLRALLAARSLGWKGLDPAIEGGFRHLARVTDERGRVGYRQAGELEAETEALTSMGALCLLLGREGPTVPAAVRGRILDGVARAAARGPEGHDLYRDFFLHSALEAFPASRRGPWPGEARRALAAAQVREGPHRGSWEPDDTWGPAGGRVYSTAIGALILRPGATPGTTRL